MGDELLITASPYGMLAAAVAGGRPVAFFVEWSASPSRIGDVHVARPLGRMSGIDACVLDIGEGEEAFLQGAGTLDADGGPPIVQVVCDAYEGKRARATRRPALAGRYAVFRPGGRGLTFSRRLRDPQIKRALGAALNGIEIPGGALAIRGAAAASPDAVPPEVATLAARWREIEATARRDRTPRRLWHAGGLLGRLLRDVAPVGTTCIAIDDRAVLERARTLAAKEAPDLAPALSFADPALPLFERHDCAGRLQAALEPEVVIPGGARLTVEETRALCAIDVDTGQAAAAAATETAEAAGREIVLRNLGGLIAIDFAGRGGARRREVQIEVLKRALAADRTPHRVLGVTAGGVVEVNRQRLGPSLRQALTESTAGAFGGRRLRLEAIAHELALAARREAASGARALTLHATPALLEALARPGDDVLARWLGIPVTLVPDPSQPHGRFAIEPGGAPAAASHRGRCSTR
ncbi:MAG: ribonuclease E/G [Rhodospirillaceae bacterium]|nr:ribonuclease E/G [Rhodospirillaceae bacterium]